MIQMLLAAEACQSGPILIPSPVNESIILIRPLHHLQPAGPMPTFGLALGLAQRAELAAKGLRARWWTLSESESR